MESDKLKLEAPWEEVRDMLLEICPELTEEDLCYDPACEEEMVNRVALRLNKDSAAAKAWIESVSHNKGLAY